MSSCGTIVAKVRRIGPFRSAVDAIPGGRWRARYASEIRGGGEDGLRASPGRVSAGLNWAWREAGPLGAVRLRVC